VTAPDNSVTTYSYLGNCTTVTDPAGKWKKHTTDALGNLIHVSELAPGGGTHETSYAYNLLNQLTLVSMPRGSLTQTRTFNYNLATGRLTSATNPETGTVSYTYNGDGSLATKTDANNQQTTYTYDTYGRLTQAAGYTYSYDTNPFDSNYSWNAAGRLTAVAWTSSSMGMNFKEMYSYSPAGLMLGKRLRLSTTRGGFDAETSDLQATFTYDNEGRYLGPQNYPDWPQSFSYPTPDTLGRPSGITANSLNPGDPSRLIIKDVIYGPAGELQQVRVYQDWAYLKQTFNYNNLFQLTRQTAVSEYNGSTTVQDTEYRFAAGQNNGRITQMKDWVSGEEVTYSYDSLNRLIQASTTGSEYGLNWTYDGFGNRTSQEVFKGLGVSSYLNYDGQTNRIATPGYGYDANGNLTVMPFLTMQYDVQNRMTQSVSTTNGTKLYAYAPSGSRVAQSAPPDPVYYQFNTWSITFYGPDGRRAADCSAAYVAPDPRYPQRLVLQASCDTVYVYFGGKLVRKEYKPTLQDGLWVYPWNWPSWGATLATDRLGSVQTGSKTTYYPYGEERDATNNDTQKFATYTRDRATSLDYANARYYSSQIARFTTADPYQSSGGPADPPSWNRYAYVQGDPVNANDPTGKFLVACFSEGAETMYDGSCGMWGGGWGSGGWGGGGAGTWFSSYDPDAPVRTDDDGAEDGCGNGDPSNQFFGSGAGPSNGGCVVPPPPPPPMCADQALLPADPGQFAALQRILNENAFSWVGQQTYAPGDKPGNPTGPIYTYSLAWTTDYMIASVLVNRVNLYSTNKYAFGYSTLLAAATGEPNPQGAGIYLAALTSRPDSADCLNLMMAIDALNFALGTPYPNIYYWKAVKQPNIGGHGWHLRPFDPNRDIRVGFTDFRIGIQP
jgi:RHS repeat-associated protein